MVSVHSCIVASCFVEIYAKKRRNLGIFKDISVVLPLQSVSAFERNELFISITLL